MFYLDFLKALHGRLAPPTYLEIGIRHGDSLALASGDAVGIDPFYDLRAELRDDVKLFRETSDEFFDRDTPLEPFGGRRVAFSFIDGMHLAEFVVRDFANVERVADWTSVIVFDDVLPRTARRPRATAARAPGRATSTRRSPRSSATGRTSSACASTPSRPGSASCSGSTRSTARCTSATTRSSPSRSRRIRRTCPRPCSRAPARSTPERVLDSGRLGPAAQGARAGHVPPARHPRAAPGGPQGPGRRRPAPAARRPRHRVSDFRIAVDQAVLDDLRARVAATRWPPAIDGAGWERGTDIDYLRALAARWLEYDWRAEEDALNALDHVRIEVDGFGLHAVVQRAADPAAVPLLLLHGWPDSFLRYRRVLPLLRDFHVVVPSLPGYGFSDKPAAPGYSTRRFAELVAGLMTALGHERFLASGGDIGGGVADWLAHGHADRLLGLHLTDVPYSHLLAVDAPDLSKAEREFLAAGRAWGQREGAYAAMQATKPMTAAYGLSDSPLGLAAWIVEKLRAWSDCDGDLERRFTLDDVLSHVTLYWVTNTIGSSFGPYFERETPGNERPAVPTAVALFPHDLIPAPRAFADRIFDIRRWTEMPRGGHFGAWEEPELFADDVRAFAAEL